MRNVRSNRFRICMSKKAMDAPRSWSLMVAPTKPDLGAFFKSPLGKAPPAIQRLAADGRVALKQIPKHVHGPGCGHDHTPKAKQKRPPQNRPAEGGGLAIQLALEQFLPEES